MGLSNDWLAASSLVSSVSASCLVTGELALAACCSKSESTLFVLPANAAAGMTSTRAPPEQRGECVCDTSITPDTVCGDALSLSPLAVMEDTDGL